MILIAYDGSAAANHAIAVAGALLRGSDARVVHVWEPLASLEDVLPVPGVGLPAGLPLEEIGRQEAIARGVVDAGVELAREAGFDADGETVPADGSPAQTLERAVDRLRPELVVI